VKFDTLNGDGGGVCLEIIGVKAACRFVKSITIKEVAASENFGPFPVLLQIARLRAASHALSQLSYGPRCGD
jgi:hypothetical protein